jgi:Domain of unknown function (DUF4352)
VQASRRAEYKAPVSLPRSALLTWATVGACIALSCREQHKPHAGASESSPAWLDTTENPALTLDPLNRNGSFELVALNTKTCTVAAPLRPAPGLEKLGVEVKITGLTEREVPVNPFYAELRDETGQRFESSLAGCGPTLPVRRVQRGETASGWLTFDVPQGVRNLQLRYAPIVVGLGRVPSIQRLDR